MYAHLLYREVHQEKKTRRNDAVDLQTILISNTASTYSYLPSETVREPLDIQIFFCELDEYRTQAQRDDIRVFFLKITEPYFYFSDKFLDFFEKYF